MGDEHDVGQPPSTPETRRNFRKSSFARLCDKGEITGEMLRSAQEIEEVYLGLTRGLWTHPPSLELIGGSRQRDMSLKLAWAHRKRWLPWARITGKDVAIVVDVLIDQRFMGEVARAHRSRVSVIKFRFRRALLSYAVVARWCPLSELIEFDRGHLRPRPKASPWGSQAIAAAL